MGSGGSSVIGQSRCLGNGRQDEGAKIWEKEELPEMEKTTPWPAEGQQSFRNTAEQGEVLDRLIWQSKQ